MAIDYGLSLGFDFTDLILALLITQFVGFPCALIYGKLGECIGPRKAIYAGLVVYLLVERDDLAELVAYREDRVERGGRVLKYHGYEPTTDLYLATSGPGPNSVDAAMGKK